MNFRQSACALAVASLVTLPCHARAQAEGTTLRVLKKLVPPSDSGLFKLKIDGVVRANNIGNGGTTGNVHVTPGSHAVSEAAGSSTNLTKYSTIFGGDCDASGHVVLVAGDHKTCIITNTLLGTLKVTKKLSPAESGKFNLTIDGHIYADHVGHGGSTGQVPVSPGTHSVGEIAVGSQNLCNFITSYSGDCDAAGHVTVPAGSSKTCIITNQLREWTPKASMPTTRYYFGAAAIGNKIYAVGGQNGWLDVLERYDSVANTWSTLAPMPTPRTGVAAAALGGLLYAVGGNSSTAGSSPVVATVEAYDPTTNTWATKAPMPTARDGLALGVMNGKLYAIGGRNSVFGSALNTVEVYDPTTNTWASKTPLPGARTWHGIAVHNSRLYVIGGRTGSDGSAPLATVFVYNPNTNTWTNGTSLPSARRAIGAVTVNGRLHAIGYGRGNTVFTPSTATWFNGVQMIHGRQWLGVAAVNGVIYAIGGYSNTEGVMNSVEAYEPCAGSNGPR
jgi:N-acetylneuraminic acid mutarotase